MKVGAWICSIYQSMFNVIITTRDARMRLIAMIMTLVTGVNTSSSVSAAY